MGKQINKKILKKDKVNSFVKQEVQVLWNKILYTKLSPKTTIPPPKQCFRWKDLWWIVIHKHIRLKLSDGTFWPMNVQQSASLTWARNASVLKWISLMIGLLLPALPCITTSVFQGTSCSYIYICIYISSGQQGTRISNYGTANYTRLYKYS